MVFAQKDEETLDDLLQGRLRIYQKKSGFRYSIDALLLAHFASRAIKGTPPARSRRPDIPVRQWPRTGTSARQGFQALDLGSGTGVIPLVLSQCEDIDHIVGLEIAEPLVEMSRRSVSLNGLKEKITIIEGDIRKAAPKGLVPINRDDLPLAGTCALRKGSFDLITSNPPYRRKGEGRINPDRHKAIARHELAVNLDDILKACSYLIKRRGIVCFVYIAYRMTDLVTGLRKVGIEPARIRFIHSREGEPAKMLLVEGRQEGLKKIKIEPPLIVYRDATNYTEEVNIILQGPSCEKK